MGNFNFNILTFEFKWLHAGTGGRGGEGGEGGRKEGRAGTGGTGGGKLVVSNDAETFPAPLPPNLLFMHFNILIGFLT